MTSEHAKIIRLARNFPTLEDAPLEPWDPVVFDAWAAGPAGTSGSRHAAAFILAVWHVPANPVAVVRENLCRGLHEVLEGCERRAYDAEETAPPLVQRRINNARDKALAAWRSYQLGELDEAREAAAAAAAIVDIYAPLARWLAAERPLPAADVLRQLGDVEVWRVGTFNAAAALAVWDAEHREAFCTWARAPWFC